MTLRRKTLLILVLTLASLVGVLWALARTVLLEGFARVEEHEVRERMGQVRTLVSAELASLGTAAEDYAHWDATYSFMETRDPRYPVDQLPRSDSTALRVQFLALLDTSRQLVFGKSLDLERKLDGPLPAGLADALANGRVPLRSQDGTTGLVMLPDGPALLAARSILTTAKQGPSRGFLVFGRSLDDWQLAKLAREANLPLVLKRPDDPGPRELRLSDERPVMARPRNEHSLSAYALLKDLAGKPAIVLSADLPRPVYAQGRASLGYLTASVFLVGLGLGGVGLLLIETLALSRLRRLAAAVDRIGTAGDLTARLRLPGDDELSALAAALNRMLDALAGSQLRLQQSEARLRDIVEHSTNLFFSRSLEHVVTYMSPQARGFLDIEPDAPALWSEFLTENPVNVEGLAHAQKAIETDQRQPPYALELQGRSGRRIWVEVNEAPVVRDGKTVAVVGALTDITARKRAEADKVTLEEQLLQAQKMEAVGRLAGGVAHDFNNMLGVISGYGELLARDLGPQHPGQGRLEQIRKAAERAASLTRQLLAFGRKQVLQPTILDLSDVVIDVEKMLRRLIGEDIQLVTVLGRDLWRVKADLGQIEQVIVNLAVNARDAMPQGGRLIIETSNTTLEGDHALPGVPPGAYVLLTVSDTGHGMDEATTARVFEPFFTTKEVGKGTGLGLSTVFGIVKQSDGHIEVESAPGQGTRFEVYLPRVAAAETPTDQAAAGPGPVPHGSETVLLAEDEESLRKMVQEILTAGGYAVLAAASPEAALALAPTHPGPLQLLLTDVVMPRMSGREMAARLRLLRPEIRVLYMSGYTDEAMGHHGILGAGVNFIQKPFDPDALLRKVRAVLDAPAPQQL